MAARRIRGVAPKDTTRPDSEPVEMDATTTIRASVLRYVNDSMPGIRRRRCGCGFRYTGLNGTAITSGGGGGFLLLYAPPEKVRPARSMLRDCGLRELPFDFETLGVHSSCPCGRRRADRAGGRRTSGGGV